MNMPKEIKLIDISVKAQSKKEVYLVLTVEGVSIYLQFLIQIENILKK